MNKYGAINPLKSKISPKGSEWLVEYNHNNKTIYRALIFNYETGLTAFEAWQASNLRHSPGYSQVTCQQLTPFPYPSELNNDRERLIDKRID